MHFDGASRDTRILQAALDYRRQGFSVIPLWPRQKEPALALGACHDEQASYCETAR
jgi:hypothetical protein